MSKFVLLKSANTAITPGLYGCNLTAYGTVETFDQAQELAYKYVRDNKINIVIAEVLEMHKPVVNVQIEKF